MCVGRGKDVVDVGQECRFENVRLRRDAVLGADPFDGRVQVIESLILNRGGDLGGVTADVNRLAGNDTAASLLHRAQYGIYVQRHQAAQVNDLGADAPLSLQFVSSLKAVVHDAVPRQPK